jgi:hypothetical protein
MSEKQTRLRLTDEDGTPSEIVTLVRRIKKMFHHKKRSVCINALVNALAHITIDTSESEQDLRETAEQIIDNFNMVITSNLEQLNLEMHRPPSATDVIN